MTVVETETPGVHLERARDRTAHLDALADLLGGRVGLVEVADNLKLTARESRLGRLGGRAVERALAWNAHDSADPVWWPQGITTSADASALDAGALDASTPAGSAGRWHGRRLAVTTWYAKPHDGVRRGSRISVLDLDTLRYRHVLLVDPGTDERGRPQFSPITVHAGGIVWAGEWLHVAATRRGFLSFHLDDVLRIPDDNRQPQRIGVHHDDLPHPDTHHRAATPPASSFGHHYVLPARLTHRATTDEGHEPLRHSFLSLDASSTQAALLVGEYGRGSQSTRLVRYPLDPATGLPVSDAHGRSPAAHSHQGVRQMQGVAVVDGRLHLSVSRGPFLPGSVYTGPCTGTPGALRQHWFAQPIGPEDFSYSSPDDRIWAVSEHPRRRWVYSMRRDWFDHRRGFGHRGGFGRARA